MATVRGSKKTVIIWSLVGILVIGAWLLVSVTQAGAETVKKLTTTTYIAKVEVIPIFDVEGHIVGIYERRGVAIFEDGEVAAYLTRGTFDYIKGQGSHQGYTQYTFKDGSTTVEKYQGTTTIAPGEKLASIKGKGEYIKGTGRFKGIKGNMSYSGKLVTPYGKETKGDLVFDTTATYTLPSK